jgi:hypothetical protein
VLTVDDYGAIRRARRDGKSIRRIAREFDHSRNTIRGTDLGFGSAFDPLVSSARVLVPGTSMRSFISLSCSRDDDRLAGRRLVRVLITPEENADTFSPSFSLGSCRSRGRPSRYAENQSSAQSAPTPFEDLPAQRVSAQVYGAVLEPAVLPRPGMSATTPSLAGNSPPG